MYLPESGHLSIGPMRANYCSTIDQFSCQLILTTVNKNQTSDSFQFIPLSLVINKYSVFGQNWIQCGGSVLYYKTHKNARYMAYVVMFESIITSLTQAPQDVQNAICQCDFTSEIHLIKVCVSRKTMGTHLGNITMINVSLQKFVSVSHTATESLGRQKWQRWW